ncbi:hypothetical protein BV210_08920 [Halorientalis sp. IM1011]|uniref:hypothetical protein n=1 Tax=Halorientalis sp. IM1011 TaxID=1932360 RepID=UPI00097CCB25|nr:hypothetical protein [Halorientalis sp. IM1011]AQL42825.1 hypothetical protein BV210_08920 [Halorientalis sp. IM1011]
MDWGRGTWMVAVGAILIVGVVIGGFAVFDSDYVHELENDSAAFNASKEGHLRYANLSERGQTAVERTIQHGEYVVDSESETAPEFEYTTDGATLGRGWYVVQREGRAYEITTSRDGPGMGLGPLVISAVVLLPLAMIGSALLAFGAWRQRNGD